MPLRASEHAIQRYIERVQALPREQVEQILTGRAFRAATRIGARVVRFPGRARAVIAYGRHSAVVVTVVPEIGIPKPLWPHWMGGPVPISCYRKWGSV
jgi:hypothetical protein|nr:MAG TPA_asm: hypothetical protein [Caudoviricetes sp.]